jgi:phosphoribosylformylglycinamidine synthase
MKTVWEQDGEERSVTAPLSVVISAFAPVGDVRATLTPELRGQEGAGVLLVDLGRGRNRLGGSALAQVLGGLGDAPADLDDPADLRGAFEALRQLRREGLVLAYHDRSDGGLLVALLEMAFAARIGLDVDISGLSGESLGVLFAEEPGLLLQVPRDGLDRAREVLAAEGLGDCSHAVAVPVPGGRIRVRRGGTLLLDETRASLQRCWQETSYRMQALRDDPDCARQEFDAVLDEDDPGISPRLGFDPAEDVAAPFVARGARPRLAVLREQGVNGQQEMAAAFHRAGFDAVDVHMSDLMTGRQCLADFKGLVACGGFSYGDVLGAGEGWAKSVLFNEGLCEQFAAFAARPDSFGLGVCNGCQMLANLRELIPGTELWPHFVRNASEQFEARFVSVEVLPSASLFLAGMSGSVLPVAVAHGEGRCEFPQTAGPQKALAARVACLRYVDNGGRATEAYPLNPNGSPAGLTGLTSRDGRFTIMMPHPERVFRTVQNSWHPADWGDDGPWLRMFRNARLWLG